MDIDQLKKQMKDYLDTLDDYDRCAICDTDMNISMGVLQDFLAFTIKDIHYKSEVNGIERKIEEMKCGLRAIEADIVQQASLS